MGNVGCVYLGAMETNHHLRKALIRRCFVVSTFVKMAISRIFVQLCRLLISLALHK